MITFEHKSRDASGRIIQGVVEADNLAAARKRLQAKGYTPLSVHRSAVQPKTARPDRMRVRFADLNMFTLLLYTLQKAGLPIMSSLRAIRDQSGNPVLRGVVDQIAQKIESGSKLSDALEGFPAIFNPIYVNMVRAGEISGRLPEILERLASLGEHDERVRMSIRAALRYPLMVVAVLIIGFISLILIVVPRFVDLFARFETSLPLPTQMLLAIYYAIVHFWWAILLALVVLGFVAGRFVATPYGRYQRDRVLLRIPVFGALFLKISLSRFCRVTATLLKSGIPILQILDLSRAGAGNVVIARAIERIRNSVNDGKGMLEPMKASRLFPPVVTQMVAVGEETGKLDELLSHVADYYDSQVEYAISNLVSLIEPILIIFLGGAVLFMALGIFMPMWNLMSLFK